jgi:hypothetical protein
VRLKRTGTGDRLIHRGKGVGAEQTAFSKSHGKVVCPHAATVVSVLCFVFIRSDKAMERAKRCVNTGSDDCINGYYPGAGNDGNYFGGDDTPGKRATLDTLSPTALRKALLRCLNTGGDDCINGGLPGAGSDDGYFGGDNTPGKRATLRTLSPAAFRQAYLRCLNTGGDDCINGGLPGAGSDDGYFGGDNTPGKRSLPQINKKSLCLLFPMSSACRNE